MAPNSCLVSSRAYLLRAPNSESPVFSFTPNRVHAHLANRMSLFGRFKNLFRNGQPEDFRKPLPPIIQVSRRRGFEVQYNVNPAETWEIIGELGDGAFGKVEKAVNRQNRNQLAASKVQIRKHSMHIQAIEVQEGEDLEDFLVEIEILTSCKHENIVGLYACYFFEKKLHVR